MVVADVTVPVNDCASFVVVLVPAIDGAVDVEVVEIDVSEFDRDRKKFESRTESGRTNAVSG